MKARGGVRAWLYTNCLQFLGVVEQLLIDIFHGNCIGALMKYPFLSSEKIGRGCCLSAIL